MKIQTNRFIRDFLLVVNHIISSFSESLLIQIRKTTLNIVEIIENFRHNVHMLKNAKSAFFHILLSRFTIQKTLQKNRTKN